MNNRLVMRVKTKTIQKNDTSKIELNNSELRRVKILQ